MDLTFLKIKLSKYFLFKHVNNFNKHLKKIIHLYEGGYFLLILSLNMLTVSVLCIIFDKKKYKGNENARYSNEFIYLSTRI